MPSLASLTADINARDNASGTLRAVGAEVDALAGKMNKTGGVSDNFLNKTGGAMLGVGGAVTGLMALSSAPALDFNQTMANLRAFSDVTQTESEKIGGAIKQIAADSRYNANEVGTATVELAKAGLTAEQLIGGAIQGTVDLAAAAGISVEDAATASARNLVTWGDDISESMRWDADDSGVVETQEQMNAMNDISAAAAGQTLLDMKDITDAYADMGSGLLGMGQDYETGMALLAAGSAQFASGSEAGNAVNMLAADLTANRAVFEEMTGVALTDAEGNFRDLTDVIMELDDATQGMSESAKQDLFAEFTNVRSARALGAALRYDDEHGGKTLAGLEEGLLDVGAAERMAEEQMDSFQGKWEEFHGAIERARIGVGTAYQENMMPGLEAATGIINDATSAFEGLSPEMQRSVVGMVSMAGSALGMGGAFLLAVPKIRAIQTALAGAAEGTGVLATAARLVPGLLTGMGVAALAAGLAFAAYKSNFLGFADLIDNVVVPALGNLKDELGGKISGLKNNVNQFRTLADIIADGRVADGGTRLAGIIAGIGYAMDAMMGTTVADEMETLADAIDAVATGAQNAAANGFNPLAAALGGLAAGAAEMGWSDIADRLYDAQQAAELFGDTFRTVQSTMEMAGFSGLASTIAGLGAALEAVTGLPVEDFFRDVATAVQTFDGAMQNAINQGINPGLAVLEGLKASLQAITGLPVVDFFNDLGMSIQDAIGGAGSVLGGAATAIADFVGSVAGSIRSFDFDGLGAVLQEARANVESWLQEQMVNIPATIQATIDLVVDAVLGAISFVGEIAGQIHEELRNWLIGIVGGGAPSPGLGGVPGGGVSGMGTIPLAIEALKIAVTMVGEPIIEGLEAVRSTVSSAIQTALTTLFGSGGAQSSDGQIYSDASSGMVGDLVSGVQAIEIPLDEIRVMVTGAANVVVEGLEAVRAAVSSAIQEAMTSLFGSGGAQSSDGQIYGDATSGMIGNLVSGVQAIQIPLEEIHVAITGAWNVVVDNLAEVQSALGEAINAKIRELVGSGGINSMGDPGSRGEVTGSLPPISIPTPGEISATLTGAWNVLITNSEEARTNIKSEIDKKVAELVKTAGTVAEAAKEAMPEISVPTPDLTVSLVGTPQITITGDGIANVWTAITDKIGEMIQGLGGGGEQTGPGGAGLGGLPPLTLALGGIALPVVLEGMPTIELTDPIGAIGGLLHAVSDAVSGAVDTLIEGMAATEGTTGAIDMGQMSEIGSAVTAMVAAAVGLMFSPAVFGGAVADGVQQGLAKADPGSMEQAGGTTGNMAAAVTGILAGIVGQIAEEIRKSVAANPEGSAEIDAAMYDAGTAAGEAVGATGMDQFTKGFSDAFKAKMMETAEGQGVLNLVDFFQWLNQPLDIRLGPSSEMEPRMPTDIIDQAAEFAGGMADTQIGQDLVRDQMLEAGYSQEEVIAAFDEYERQGGVVKTTLADSASATGEMTEGLYAVGNTNDAQIQAYADLMASEEAKAKAADEAARAVALANESVIKVADEYEAAVGEEGLAAAKDAAGAALGGLMGAAAGPVEVPGREITEPGVEPEITQLPAVGTGTAAEEMAAEGAEGAGEGTAMVNEWAAGVAAEITAAGPAAQATIQAAFQAVKTAALTTMAAGGVNTMGGPGERGEAGAGAAAPAGTGGGVGTQMVQQWATAIVAEITAAGPAAVEQIRTAMAALMAQVKAAISSGGVNSMGGPGERGEAGGGAGGGGDILGIAAQITSSLQLAAQAATTGIQGVVTALQGLTTGISQVTMEIANAMSSMTTTISGSFTAISTTVTTGVQTITTAFQGLVTSIGQVTMEVANALSSMASTITGSFTAMQGQVQGAIDALIGAVQSIVPALNAAAAAAGAAAAGIGQAIVGALDAAVPQVAAAAGRLGAASVVPVQQQIESGSPSKRVMPWALSIGEALIVGLTEKYPEVAAAAQKLGAASVEGIQDFVNDPAVQDMAREALGVVDEIIHGFQNGEMSLEEAGTALGDAAIDGISRVADDPAVKEFATEVGTALDDATTGVGDAANAVGEEIEKGHGAIKEMVKQRLEDAGVGDIRGMVQERIDAIMGKFKEGGTGDTAAAAAEDGLGSMIESMKEGLMQGAPAVEDAAKTAMEGVASEMAPATTGAGEMGTATESAAPAPTTPTAPSSAAPAGMGSGCTEMCGGGPMDAAATGMTDAAGSMGTATETMGGAAEEMGTTTDALGESTQMVEDASGGLDVATSTMEGTAQELGGTTSALGEAAGQMGTAGAAMDTASAGMTQSAESIRATVEQMIADIKASIDAAMQASTATATEIPESIKQGNPNIDRALSLLEGSSAAPLTSGAPAPAAPQQQQAPMAADYPPLPDVHVTVGVEANGLMETVLGKAVIPLRQASENRRREGGTVVRRG